MKKELKKLSSFQKLVKEAESLREQNQFVASLSRYEQALEIDPQGTSALYGKAVICSVLGRLDEAIRIFEKVAVLEKNDASIYNNLGVLCFKLDRLDKAKGHFTKALQLDENYQEALYGLGKVLLKQGQKQEAIAALEKCKHYKPAQAELARLVRSGTEPVQQKPPESILIVMEQGIGNMVMMTPALRAIRNHLPQVHLAVLGTEPAMQVIRGWQVVDEVFTTLPQKNFDLTMFSIWSQNVKAQWGDHLKILSREIYSAPVPNFDVHESDLHLQMARHIGYEGPAPAPFCMSAEITFDLPKKGLVIGIADTALDVKGWERKRWPYYPQLAEKLIENDHTVVLIGGKAEAAKFRPEAWPRQVQNFMGRLSLQETASLIQRCDVVVTNDSGPAHVSAALGTPTLVLFGPTKMSKNIPLGEKVKAVSLNLECSPCQYTGRWEACSDWRCMNELTTDRVLPFLFEKEEYKSTRVRIKARGNEKLLLVGKSYADCRIIEKDGRLFVTKDGIEEPLTVHLVGAGKANYPWGMENEISRALKEMGIQVIETDYRLDRENFPALFMRPAHFMLVCKGSGISPDLIGKYPGRTLLWYQDDVFTTAHAPRDLAFNGSAFDTVYSFDKSAVDEYKKFGIKDVRWLPLAASPAVHRKMDVPKKYDVSFVGNIHPNRKPFLERLQKKFNVHIERAFMDDMVRILNQSRIVLNLGIGPTGIQQRVFEVLSCGSFLLTNEIPEADRLFENHTHLVYFNDENIEDLISYYLEHDQERENIAYEGYLEAHEKHTFHQRMHVLLGQVFPDYLAETTRPPSLDDTVQRSPQKRPQKRLLVFWHGIGDNVMATPALRAFRRKHPHDFIGFMYLERIHKDGLMKGNPYIDELYTCSDAWDDYPNYETGVTAVMEEAKAVARREGYDEIIPITMRACSLERHRIDRIAYELDVEPESCETELYVSNADRRRAEEIFRQWGIRENDFVIAIHRRGANVNKFWDVEQAQEFVDAMKKSVNARFIAFETHTDLDRETGPQFRGDGIFTTAELDNVTLRLSAALIDRCNLFVGIDSGPMWLATTTRTPIIALFTLTWMHQSAPLNTNSLLIASQNAWEICSDEFKNENQVRIIHDAAGGTTIRAETVLSAVNRIFPQIGDVTPLEKVAKTRLQLPRAFHSQRAYWGAFLTLACTANCSYCIQKMDYASFQIARRTNILSGRQWVHFLNAIEHKQNQPIALIGGEPSLHPDFITILNNLEGYVVTVTTNLISRHFSNVDEFVKKLHTKSPVRFNTSFHPGFISAEDYIARVKRMRELGLWVDQVAMVDHPNSDYQKYREVFARHGLALRSQTFLGYWKGKLYPTPDDPYVTNDPREHGIYDLRLYKEGFSARQKSSIYCQTRRFLIAPDGLVYNCHYHLYSRTNPVGDLLKDELNLKEDYYYCEDFGFCNPCDFPNVRFRRIDETGLPEMEGEETMAFRNVLHGIDS